LINHIALVSNKSDEAQKILMIGFLADAKELINHNEWGLAMENLLDSIDKVNFIVDKTTIELTKTAVKECQMDYSKFIYIEKLLE
jgi:hypothetical protein